MKILVWLLALALSPAGLAEVRIWAVGDCVRVNPVKGKLLEDRLDIHKDYPTGDYRSSNSIWNAASKTQGVVRRSAAALHWVRAHFPWTGLVPGRIAPEAGRGTEHGLSLLDSRSLQQYPRPEEPCGVGGSGRLVGRLPVTRCRCREQGETGRGSKIARLCT